MQAFETRIRQHFKRKTGRRSALRCAVEKYGQDAFITEVLVYADSIEYLQELEKKAIVAFNSAVPNGYNLTGGGEEGFWNVDREIHRKAMKEAMNRPKVKAKCSASAKLRERTAEYKNRISEGNKRAWARIKAGKDGLHGEG